MFESYKKRKSAALIFKSDSVEINFTKVNEFLSTLFEKVVDIKNHNIADIIYISSELLDKNSIGVADVKQYLEKNKFKSFGGGLKIIIINNAQDLTQEAQNTLLKTIEEPADSMFIVLTVTNLSKILPTIKSRCELYDFDSHTKVNNEDLKLGSEILSKSLLEKFAYVKEITAEKDIVTRKQKIENLFVSLIENIKNYSDSEMKFNTLEYLEKTHSYYRANVNLRLVLENLMIYLDEKLKS